MLMLSNFGMYEYLVYWIGTLLVFSLAIILVQNNPVQAVFSFILTALITFLMLLILGAEFFALLVLIIYTGVITVLFLFVVIMYNLRGLFLAWTELINPYIIVPVYKVFWFQDICAGCLEPFVLKQLVCLDEGLLYTLDVVYLVQLFNDHFFLFLMCGLLIFVAMLGSIVITYPFYKQQVE